MTTPLVTIADALIEFILSLLRDPNAAAEFAASPEEALERAGLGDVCGADVRSVVPVIVDHPDVMPRPPAPHAVAPRPQDVSPGRGIEPPRPEVPGSEVPHTVVPKPPTVVEEISHVANNFQIDNRSTIVDQSINQSIWAEGDVMQAFDHEAVLAMGDGSMAAGHDATVDSSTKDTTMGDVGIGNTETNTEINDSFNDESIAVDVSASGAADDSFNNESITHDVDMDVEDSLQDAGTADADPGDDPDVDLDVDTDTAPADEETTGSSVVEPDATAAVFDEHYEEDSSEDYSSDEVDDYFDMDYDEA